MRSKDDTDVGFLGGTNYQRICDHLRNDILDYRFEMGTRLKVVELAARYGVSQMPIREALQQLQGEGLIRLIPNRGAVVRAVDESFISNIYDIREILEIFFTRRAAMAAGEADIADLAAIQERYEQHKRVDDIAMRVRLNLDFHGRLYQLAGNEDAREIINKHAGIARALVRRYNHSAARIDQICSQHRAIIAAIAARDADKAGEIAGRHMRDARDELLAKLRDDPVVRQRARATAGSPADRARASIARVGSPER